jgi:hypothetical protein
MDSALSRIADSIGTSAWWAGLQEAWSENPDAAAFTGLVMPPKPDYEPGYLGFHEHRTSESDLRRQNYTWGLGFMAFVDKSNRNDSSQRAQFRRLVTWWIRDQICQS